jgi:hypothetical protein
VSVFVWIINAVADQETGGFRRQHVLHSIQKILVSARTFSSRRFLWRN